MDKKWIHHPAAEHHRSHRPVFLASAYKTNTKGILYAWQGQLRDQITQFSSEEAAKRMVEHKQLFVRYGGVPTPAGEQINIILHTLKGREQQFVQELMEFGQEISSVLSEPLTRGPK